MTIDQTQPGSALATQEWSPGVITGLEDFTAEDLKLARLVIDQKQGIFRDSLSGVEYTAIHAITLGVIKQRVLWQATVEDDSSPMCKSTDNTHGYPTTWEKPQNNFPWAASGWQPSDFPKDEFGRIVLPCESCKFTQWKSHPDGKKPWCSIQHAVPLLYAEVGSDPFAQAVFTFQRSSIPSSQAYFASFIQRGMPAFSASCEITLNKQRRGQNDYYVPVLRLVGPTDQSEWPRYASDYETMRGFLTRPPVTRDESGEVVVANLAQSNVIQAQPGNGFGNNTWVPDVQPQQAPMQPVHPVVTSPIATPVQQAPVQQYAPVQTIATPVQVATPVQQVQPQYVQPTPVIPTVQAQTPEDDDLPF